jgi:hypothetical protein
LLDALRDTDYTIGEDNGVLVLMAGDMTARQRDLLTHVYSDFKLEPYGTMVELGAGLTMWMRAAIDPQVSFGASIGGATNDERFTLEAIQLATTEEIANRIVSLGSRACGFSERMHIHHLAHRRTKSSSILINTTRTEWILATRPTGIVS